MRYSWTKLVIHFQHQRTINMTYKQLLEVLQRMHECYLDQQVTFSSGEEDEQVINAARISYFTYLVNDPNMPTEGNFVLAFD